MKVGEAKDPGAGTRSEGEASLRTIDTLHGPAGSLEAVLNSSRASGPPVASVLLCHPHPLYGGTLHNKVVYHAMKTFTECGLPVLRFNFRGVGRSQGVHDGGRGEQGDAQAGVRWLLEAYGTPVLAAGFSFGAHVALRCGCDHPSVAALVSLGTPVEAGDRHYTYEFLQNCRKPKLFLSGTCDPFGPVDRVEAALAGAAEPKQLRWVEGADHFFVGQLDSMRQQLRGWLHEAALPALGALGPPSPALPVEGQS